MKFKTFIFGILFMIFLTAVSIPAREITCGDQPFNLWKFDEGTDVITNESCYNYPAYFYGGMSWGEGVYGNATNFNGVDSYIYAGNVGAFSQNLTEFSFSLWINVSNRSAWQSLFQRGNYYTYEFIEAIQINEGIEDYFLFMGASTLSIMSIDDGLWHNIIGTFNGSSGEVNIYIDGNFTANYTTAQTEIAPNTDILYFGANYANGFVLNGTLDEIAFFNWTLSQAEVTDFFTTFDCSAQNNSIMTLYVPSYPYIDLNTSYPISVSLLTDNISNPFTDLGIKLQNSSGSIFIFNLTWDSGDQLYKTNLTFLEEGYYPFTIFPYTPCKTANITGTFRVFEPYYITLRLFELKDKANTTAIYKNDFSYIIAYFKNQQTDANMENFVVPLSFKLLFNQSTFHSPYISGTATLKLYEPRSYILRLIDGNIDFPNGEYSVPNISKSYGTNIYLGDYNFNGTNASYDVYLREREIHPYSWIANWLLVIGILFCIIGATFIFFTMPDKPSSALTLGLGGTAMLTLLRIVIWIWRGI
jgi:hypothetical protein